MTDRQMLDEAIRLLRVSSSNDVRVADDKAALLEAYAALPVQGEGRGELERLRDLARDVYDSFECVSACEKLAEDEFAIPSECECGGDDCWKCAAAQALEPPSWATEPK